MCYVIFSIISLLAYKNPSIVADQTKKSTYGKSHNPHYFFLHYQGQYKVRGGVFSIEELIKYIPAWLVSGDYYIHATAQKKGVSLGCYNLYVSVSY